MRQPARESIGPRCVACLAVAGVGRVPVRAPVASRHRRDQMPVTGLVRRPSRSFATPTPSRTSSRRPCADALFGLGYVHAQDRLWQMEFQRRIGHGRLSEIFGAATVSQDRFLAHGRLRPRRARGLGADCRRGRRQRVNAYVAGVNAFIATHQGARLPPGVHAAPLRARALVRRRRRGLGQDDGLGSERRTTRSSCCGDDLVRAVGVERMQQLMPPYAEDGLSIVEEPATVRPSGGPRKIENDSAPQSLRRPSSRPRNRCRSALSSVRCREVTPTVRDFLLGGAVTESLGSNNWVVDGTLSATGKPLLANDPHLGHQAPVHLVPRAPVGRRLRRDRRDAARAPRRSRSDATASSPGARPTSPPTSRISTESGSTRPVDSPVSAAWRSR